MTLAQVSVLGFAAATVLLAACLFPHAVMSVFYWLLWSLFMGNAVLRLWACTVAAPKPNVPDIDTDDSLPTYTIVVALLREADIVPQLVHNLKQIDYPAHRTQFLFVLEDIDKDTQAAFSRVAMPGHFRTLIVPDSYPRTKPRALNHALKYATGELLVIYDAEDQPHPLQLREATALFANAPLTLACAQAPLRPKGWRHFIGKQFSAEYAVHFDLFLPALMKAGISFPLGGTSNHFRTDVLRKLGGWDEYNVTEDADLGLRLAGNGYKSHLLTLPTIETPPDDTCTWLPQRTRWIKGYMQTLLVHTRFNRHFHFDAMLALFLGVIISLVCAVVTAPLTLMAMSYFSLILIQIMVAPDVALAGIHIQDIVLFFTGWSSALLCYWVGARRAGMDVRIADLAGAPFYWMLHTMAACYAFFQLIMKPHHWDKTEHTATSTAPLSALTTREVTG